jgi:uroporphyrinogen-III synthase
VADPLSLICEAALMQHSDRPVIITRPLAQAEPMAARLLSLGIQAQVFPLLDIQPLSDVRELRDKLARLHSYAMVAFVSPNAIDAAFSHIKAWPAGLTAAVVGEGSRQALARHGLTGDHAPVLSPKNLQRTDSETLLEVIDLPALVGKKVLIIRAETGRELLADRLREAGVQVDQLAAYRRGPPTLDDALAYRLRDLLARPCDWVITSSEALRTLKDMTLTVAGADGWRQLCKCTLVIPHERIAQTAAALGFDQLVRTGSGDEALIAAIQSRS